MENTIRIMDALCRSMPKGCSINQASRLSGVGVATAHRALKRMEASNEVLKERVGTSLLYRPNLRNVTALKYCELSSIERRKLVLSKNPAVTAGILGLKDVADSVVLFGSVARGEHNPNDVDLLLLFARRRHVSGIEKAMPPKFSPIYMSFGEFSQKLKSGEKLMAGILKDAVVVSGEGRYWAAIRDAYEKD